MSQGMWSNLLRQLQLSKTEQEVVRRFAEEPNGRGFLPVADVLRSHKLFDESIELLIEGVQRHPNFAVARVVLARELFQRGLVIDAWRYLEESAVSIHDNVLAQKLKYKIAILLGDEKSADEAYKNLKIQQGMDPEIKRLAECLETEGIVVTRDRWRQDLLARGITLTLPTGMDVLPVSQNSNRPQAPLGEPKARGAARFVLDYDLDEETRREVNSFHVVPLSEVFSPDQSTVPPGQGPSPIELDSTTLAEIYSKQGHYARALGIYRRLLRLSPHNDLLKLKVSEMARLEKEQRDEDIQVDPVIYDRMETVEIIDRQMRIYDELLERLK